MTSVVFVAGLSGLTINIGQVAISGMALSAITGLLFGLVFYVFDKLGVNTN